MFFRLSLSAASSLRPLSVLALAVCVTLLVTPYTWTYDQLLLILPLTTVILAMDRMGLRFPLTASLFLGMDVLVVILLFFDVMLQVEILNVLIPLVVFGLCLRWLPRGDCPHPRSQGEGVAPFPTGVRSMRARESLSLGEGQGEGTRHNRK